MGSGVHAEMYKCTQHKSLTMCRFPISANWRLLCTQNSVVRCCRCAQPEAAVHHGARRKASREGRAWGYPKRGEHEAETRNLAILGIRCGGWRIEFFHRRRYSRRDCCDRPSMPTRRVRGMTGAAKTCRAKLPRKIAQGCISAFDILSPARPHPRLQQRALRLNHATTNVHSSAAKRGLRLMSHGYNVTIFQAF